MQSDKDEVFDWSEGAALPEDLRDAVTGAETDTLTVDPGLGRLFADLRPGRCRLSRDPEALLTGTAPTLSDRALSHFLHHGFVPAPGTVHADIARLGFGDRLTVTRQGEAFRPVFTYEPIFRNARSREDQVPSTEHLLELLVGAVQRWLGDRSSVLMLSSGKDSVALALACLEAGRDDVRAITFASAPDEDEAVDAAAFARQLGVPHETVVLPDDRTEVEPIVTRCFERATEPCGDPTLVPYLLGVARAGMQPGEGLIDGLNNDSWIGYVPSAAEHRNSRIADRWLAWLRPFRGLVPPEHPLSAALRTRAEWHFFGGRWLRHTDTKRFFDGSIDTHAEWARESRARCDLDDFDFRSEVRGRHADQNAMVVKAYVAAEITGTRALFPFVDRDLIDYWFHLPEASRFDRERLVNKVLLRQLLRERVGYDDARIGKRTFQFDGPRFLTQHRRWVEHEITQCPLWSGAVRGVIARQLDRPVALQKTWPSLMALFQLSGWVRRHL